ncbi:PREDICTED: YTH domain-containing family protein 1-like [Nelumbo nucifera]|uniref:YTH domain-containing family protein n=1 Tax=Nelumbo nucifera TaxID=4432 RepID=A0A1U7ZZJ5_NELNU|nr:PREDICTED: YTH domain-containing family protein 1-like [Nelumbo nucifera]
MAAVAPPADQAADLLQKLSIDSQTKNIEVPEATKKPFTIQYGSVETAEAPNGPVQSCERSTTPLLQDFMDPSMCYLPNGYASTAYYYGGYDGHINEWDDYPRFVNPDGVEMSTGVYGDNGSLIYHHGYGYAPYGAYPPAGSPVPTMGHDGQLYGPQHYQYPSPYYQPPTPPPGGPYPSSQTSSQGELSTSVAADQAPLTVETTKEKANGVTNGNSNANNGSAPLKPTNQNSTLNLNNTYCRGVLSGGIPTSGYQDLRFGYDGMRSPVPWIDSPVFSDGQPKPATSSSFSSTVSHANNVHSGRNQNIRPLPHLVGLHHPRPASGMNPTPGFMNRMYPNNRDDVHKSIKYNVWASTPNGNKKLDAAYQEAQEKPDCCPVFLFFSVNTSGQFVGVAEMVGPVDFNKNVEYWQQDKWNGCFSVKWHIVKDVPNSLLKHITLENNENKPVTNSRDTQEVKMEQGLQMLKIFKEHSSKTCILDDFGFYETRQKTMQEKRAKQLQLQKQVWNGKPADIAVTDDKEKDGATGKPRLQKSLEVASVLLKESPTVHSNGEWKRSEENGTVTAVRDAPKGAKPVGTEKRVVANGVANGC